MFEFIKKMFVISLTSTVSASNHMKCVSSSNQTCMTHPTLINLHPNEYCQELRYYPFAINQIGVLQVATVLTTKLVEYVFQMKKRI